MYFIHFEICHRFGFERLACVNPNIKGGWDQIIKCAVVRSSDGRFLNEIWPFNFRCDYCTERKDVQQTLTKPEEFWEYRELNHSIFHGKVGTTNKLAGYGYVFHRYVKRAAILSHFHREFSWMMRELGSTVYRNAICRNADQGCVSTPGTRGRHIRSSSRTACMLVYSKVLLI